MKFKINRFYERARNYRINIVDEGKIEGQDITKWFYEEIENIIKNRELLNININGQVRTGKSTIAIKLGKQVNKIQVKHKHTKETFGLKNIARDQQEQTRIMRDPNIGYTVIVIDERDEMEESGENITIETKQRNQFSSVQAGRYVHTIYCSPKDVIDNNCNIILQVEGINKETATTHSKLFYRLFYGGEETIQLLGYVNIWVGDIIKNWEEKVRKHFMKPPNQQTKADKEQIRYWAKKDFYVAYMVKKYEKFDLMTKHGVFKPRTMQYSKVILKVIQELKPMMKFHRLVDKNLIKNIMKRRMREEGIPQTIVGEELSTNEASGVLNGYTTYYKIINDLQQLENKKEKYSVEDYEFQKIELETNKKKILELLQIQEDELQRLSDLNEQYLAK